jgi:1,4-alpha-glucan branching enzyme
VPTSQNHITAHTPMGATLTDDGATFRVWAPGAAHVYVALGDTSGYRPRPQDELVVNPTTGHWTGFVTGVADGDHYRFYVIGAGGREVLKRDPWARELEPGVALVDCDCIVCARDSYPWHDAGYRPPPFHELVVYQLHVGVFSARDPGGHDIRRGRVAKLLDVLDRIEHLVGLGVNAVQPLPLVEFHGEWSLGYNGTDLFSPETDYCVPSGHLTPYVELVNRLLAARGHPPVTRGQLIGQVNQLKAFVDVCHAYGIAVLVDVVYNHAGGDLDPHSLDYFDLPAVPDRNNSLYFSGAELAGGKVFDFGKPDVRSFLIENAVMFLDAYHADGLRFDEVTVIDRNGGWSFCQDMTATLRHRKPSAALIAEYWGDQRWRAVESAPDGMGFDLGYADGLRDGVRGVLAQAAGGADATVDLGPVRHGLQRPWGYPHAWQAYNCLENHDLVLDADGDHRQPRIARLAAGHDARSWYARSRARVATGLLLTAPGIPMLFMGQEFLEDKLWSDNPHQSDRMIWWDGLAGADRHMADFHRFVRDLLTVRRRHLALRSEPVVVYPLDDRARVLAFQRWVPGVGRDVVVVASLAETTFHGDFALGFPRRGTWHEVFNSDHYDHYPNPWTAGNAGLVVPTGDPLHGMPCSARITVPANGLVVFTTDAGDATGMRPGG